MVLVACGGGESPEEALASTAGTQTSLEAGVVDVGNTSTTGAGAATAGAGGALDAGSSGPVSPGDAGGGGLDASGGAGPVEAGATGVPADAGNDTTPSDASLADAVVDDGLPETGSLPPISDPWDDGPFAVETLRRAGPEGNATVLYPRNPGENGVAHPIVVWDNGAGQTGLSIYGALLNHIASHGFAVYAAYSATDGGQELLDGLDWMIAQAADSSSPFYEKLDTTKTAAMGHSQGSIATFAIAGDPRLTTTIHLSGGTNPDIAEGHATLPNLHRPAAFLCGEPGGDGLISGDTASEWCAYDFEHTDVPVFLVQIQGASHISAPGMTTGACAAWLRWHLTGDETMRMQFAGDDCELCKRRNWETKSKGL